MAALLRSLLLNQCFLFVGYGLKDPNVSELYREVRQLFDTDRPVAYALTLDRDADLSEFPGLVNITLSDKRDVRIFLDRLADATNWRPPMFLARDVELRDGYTLSELPHLATLADILRRAGNELEHSICSDDPLNETESRLALEAAVFLVEHGWRPKGCSIKLLADKACGESPSPELRYDWLRFALPYSEDATEVRAVWTALNEHVASPVVARTGEQSAG